MNNLHSKPAAAQKDYTSYTIKRTYLGKCSAKEAIGRIVKAKIEQYRNR